VSHVNGDGRAATLLIVNYRTPALVEQCVASVYANRGDVSLETVIVDNDSQDGSAERLRRSIPGATVIEMPDNRGFAAGVNAGFRDTDAELVLVLNPDTELRPGALEALLDRLRDHSRAGVVAPLLEDADGQVTPSAYRRFPNLLTLSSELCVPVAYAFTHLSLTPHAISASTLRDGGPVAHVCGAAMAIRREAYRQAGPLDERFFLYLEETEWQRRVAASGWTIEVEPAARACHLVRGGGDAAIVPPIHGVPSAVRYLRMQGVPKPVSRIVLGLAFIASWATLRLIAVIPGKRAKAAYQARAYRSLLRALK
jgi:GT2 family glycosyltransferase